MSKLSLFLLIAALAYCTASSSSNSDSDSSDSDSESKEEPDWPFMMSRMPEIPKIPTIKFQKIKRIDPDSIINLKPDGANSQVKGSYSMQSSKVEYKNGKKVVDEQESRVLLNDDGKVQSFSSNGGDK